MTETTQPASEVQIDGDHYKAFAIQPVDFIHANKLSFLQGNIIKYVVRHDKKGRKVDLLKAKHCIDLMIEKEYGK